jgi:hypothetical protein
MADTVGGRRIAPIRAIDLQKTRHLPHSAFPSASREISAWIGFARRRFLLLS